MDDKEKFQLVLPIVSAIISDSNIEVHFAKNFEEVGVKDKQSGSYMLVTELIDYLTKYIK